MDFTITFRGDHFEIQTTGRASSQQYAVLLDTLVAHDRWQPGTPVLSDETDLATDHLNAADVMAIANACGVRRDRIGPARMAILAQTDVVFGLNRMWEVYVGDKWDAEVQVFRSKDEALEWLAD